MAETEESIDWAVREAVASLASHPTERGRAVRTLLDARMERADAELRAAQLGQLVDDADNDGKIVHLMKTVFGVHETKTQGWIEHARAGLEKGEDVAVVIAGLTVPWSNDKQEAATVAHLLARRYAKPPEPKRWLAIVGGTVAVLGLVGTVVGALMGSVIACAGAFVVLVGGMLVWKGLRG